MSDHDDLKQKLYQALHELFTEQGIAMGLTYAAVASARNVPDEFKEEFNQIKRVLLATPFRSRLVMSAAK